MTKRGDSIVALCNVKVGFWNGTEVQDFTLKWCEPTEWKHGKKTLYHTSIIKAATQSAILDNVIVQNDDEDEDEDENEAYNSDKCECTECSKAGIGGLTTDSDGVPDAPSDSDKEKH